MTLATPLDQRTAPGGTRARQARKRLPASLVSWLQVGPLALIIFVMFVLPLAFVVVVSFFDYGRVDIYPAFILDNYAEIFTSQVTIQLYLKTLKFAVLVEAITLVLGFFVAYFLTFHVRTLRWRIIFLMACSIPFFTSNGIRMISWIPFLGRNGILNNALMSSHLIHQPLEFLLFSDFAVVVAYVHILTMMMVAPIVNSMAKIDRSLISAARDAGAKEWMIVRDIILPLSRTGLALGSVLVLTQVMGDYYVVSVLSGGQSAGVVSGIATELNAFEYPPAAASSVVLLVLVVILVVGIFRIVDVRKELAG